MAYWKTKAVSSDEFFRTGAKDGDYHKFAEKVYVMIHTFYLDDSKKIKPEMGKIWDKEFGVYLTDEMFEFMLVNEPVMLRDIIIRESKAGKEIASSKYLEKTIVAFEFDLWMIERSKAGLKLELPVFGAYITAKYGTSLKDKYRSFVKFDLMYLKEYDNIAKQLTEYEDEIRKTFEMISSNNKTRINIDDPGADRLSDFDVVIGEKKPIVKVVNTVHKPERRIKKEEQPQPVAVQAAPSSLVDSNREIQIIIREKDERIEKLEQDIKEFKRQRDEAREYSINQYDRGVKNLFSAMNDDRYGKVIDYFYSLLQDESTDEKLASYLDNLFMAFEDMEIEPIADQGSFSVKEETMVRDFNLDFDKSEYDKDKTRLKYYGWKYKDIPMEKPTLTKED